MGSKTFIRRPFLLRYVKTDWGTSVLSWEGLKGKPFTSRTGSLPDCKYWPNFIQVPMLVFLLIFKISLNEHFYEISLLKFFFLNGKYIKRYHKILSVLNKKSNEIVHLPDVNKPSTLRNKIMWLLYIQSVYIAFFDRYLTNKHW